MDYDVARLADIFPEKHKLEKWICGLCFSRARLAKKGLPSYLGHALIDSLDGRFLCQIYKI